MDPRRAHRTRGGRLHYFEDRWVDKLERVADRAVHAGWATADRAKGADPIG
jgi:hypothetical protein